MYFATTDKTAAMPNPIAVYPDEGGIGNVGDDTATATACYASANPSRPQTTHDNAPATTAHLASENYTSHIPDY